MREFLREYFSNFFWLGVIILATVLTFVTVSAVIFGSIYLLIAMIDFQSFKKFWQTLLWTRVIMITYVPSIVFWVTVYTYNKEK